MSVVYFVQARPAPDAPPAGPVKIGFTTNLEARMRELGTAHPHGLVVLHTEPGGRPEEAAFHERWARVRLNGEWFRYGAPIRAYVQGRHHVNVWGGIRVALGVVVGVLFAIVRGAGQAGLAVLRWIGGRRGRRNTRQAAPLLVPAAVYGIGYAYHPQHALTAAITAALVVCWAAGRTPPKRRRRRR